MGMIQHRCPTCRMMLNVKEEYADPKAQCPHCSAPLAIPPTSAEESVPASDPAAVALPESSLPHIVTDPSDSGGGFRRGSTAAGITLRRSRTPWPAIIASAIALMLVVVILGAAVWFKSSGNANPDASATSPDIPAPAEPSPTTLVLDWPEIQRPGSVIQIDGVQDSVPSAGPVQFKLKPGEHKLVILRRGYEPIEKRITLDKDEYRYVPQWKEPAMARADSPDPPPPVPTEPSSSPLQLEQPKLAANGLEKGAEIPAQPTLKPQTAPPSFDSPEKFLAGKGLRKHGDYWTVPEEADLGKRLATAKKLWRGVFAAQRSVEKAQETVAQGNAVMLGYVQTMGQLGAQLKVTRTIADNNRIVGAMDELKSHTVIAARQLKQLEQARDQTLAAALQESSEFEEHLIESRRLYDKVKNGYQVHSTDAAVAEAIRRFDQTSDKTHRLGPRTRFVSLGKQLEGLESKVFSEAIPLRRGDGQLWYVSVMFNGRHAKEMAIDTGASVIAMSWATAQGLRLTPGADAPTIYAQMADGSIVPCRKVFADKVRVGRFVVEDVECTVMPPGLPGSTPLLGLSFFKNFSFKIDSGKGLLVMSQIDTSKD